MSHQTSSDVLALGAIRQSLREFAAERDWDQFHTPKNLAMALAAESGELLELFQWLTPEDSISVAEDKEAQKAVAQELSDILQYVIRMADLLDIDLPNELAFKLAENEVRYPAREVRGK